MKTTTKTEREAEAAIRKFAVEVRNAISTSKRYATQGQAYYSDRHARWAYQAARRAARLALDSFIGRQEEGK